MPSSVCFQSDTTYQHNLLALLFIMHLTFGACVKDIETFHESLTRLEIKTLCVLSAHRYTFLQATPLGCRANGRRKDPSKLEFVKIGNANNLLLIWNSTPAITSFATHVSICIDMISRDLSKLDDFNHEVLPFLLFFSFPSIHDLCTISPPGEGLLPADEKALRKIIVFFIPQTKQSQ